MNALLHLLKELKVPNLEEQVHIEPFEWINKPPTYQFELDFEN